MEQSKLKDESRLWISRKRGYNPICYKDEGLVKIEHLDRVEKQTLFWQLPIRGKIGSFQANGESLKVAMSIIPKGFIRKGVVETHISDDDGDEKRKRCINFLRKMVYLWFIFFFTLFMYKCSECK